MSTGALGQGISNAAGMALSSRLQNKDFRVIVLAGDGEIQEGETYEAGSFIGTQKFGSRLTLIINHNGYQIDGATDFVDQTDKELRFRAQGFKVLKIDGHNIAEILDALDTAAGSASQPTVIIAKTVKGKGVSFMEKDPIGWHGKPPKGEQFTQALKEIGGRLPFLEISPPSPSSTGLLTPSKKRTLRQWWAPPKRSANSSE